jgi:bla regulator protein blaR1
MIASWMAAATLFSLLLGVAALAAERALRTLGRQARGPWLVALAAAVAWPIIAPVAAALLPAPDVHGAPIALPAVRTTIGTIAPALPALPAAWTTRVDAVLVALWALASALLLVRLAVALRSLSAVERGAIKDVIAGVPVCITPSLGPAVFGVRRPRLIVPRWLLDLDAPLRALVMQHEQEHCRARDPQLTLSVAVAVALMPWNLGAWWIARRLRLALELDCDARVLRATGDTERYGRLLLFIAQRQSHTKVATMLAESNSDLSRRISEMNTPRPANPSSRVAVLGLIAAAALACSTKYGTDLAATSSGDRTVAGNPQQASGTYYAPEGATPAVPLQGSGVPVYPSALAGAHIEGEVLAQFVVDTSGQVLPGSLRIVRSTDSLLTQAVRAAVPSMRFVPPELNGRKVRQLVQQPYYFDAVVRADVANLQPKEVQGSPASASRKPAPVATPTTDPTNRNPMSLPPIVVKSP